MLNLTRAINESLVINGDTKIMVTGLSPRAVVLGVAAPPEVDVLRGELVASRQPAASIPMKLDQAEIDVMPYFPPRAFCFRVGENSGGFGQVRAGDVIVCLHEPLGDREVAVVEQGGRMLLRRVRVRSSGDITDAAGRAVRPIGRVVSLLRNYRHSARDARDAHELAVTA